MPRLDLFRTPVHVFLYPIFVAWLLICASHSAHASDSSFDGTSIAGNWDCQITCPGGAIAFGLEIAETKSGGLSGYFVNGPERIRIPHVELNKGELLLKIDHYDSQISAQVSSSPKRLSGQWKKRRGKNEWVTMKFSAAPRRSVSPATDIQPFLGRWAVQFEKSSDPSVALFKRHTDSEILGTFLTTTGDYRYLHGRVYGDELQISCFDGAHAFLFRATIDDTGSLAGGFWSSNTWHEQWTATRNDSAQLPDAFKQTVIKNESLLEQLEFPDVNGHRWKLGDPKFSGKARLIYIFGSWCPNCHDAAAYFSELKTKYGDRGLSILGLAFEVTGDFKRDAEQVRKYLQRHNTDYPVLIAGISDKAEASKKIKFLDRIRSYPTTVFLDSSGKIRGVHTGFSGPATGSAHTELRTKFEAIIEKLLNESTAKSDR